MPSYNYPESSFFHPARCDCEVNLRPKTRERKTELPPLDMT